MTTPTGAGSVVREEDVGPVRIITLDRPEARNALNRHLLGALAAAFERLEADPEVRTAVLTGADPAFCAGVDLKEAAADPNWFVGAGDSGRHAANAILRVATVETPIVGAINGATFTGGLELALGCDFLIASERAYFADTHAGVGVLPAGGMTVRLPQAVGYRRALQMSLTGEHVDARRAEQIGLVNEVVAHDDLLPRALVVAAGIAAGDPTTVRAIKAGYVAASRETLARALEIERQRASEWNGDLPDLASRRDQTMAANRAKRADE